MRTTIQIATKDRHSELAILLQSLRTQTYKDFDILIADESETPINTCHFLMSIIARIKHDGNKLEILRHYPSQGVCAVRNFLIDSDNFNNPLVCRLDDDVILEPDYLEKLHHGIKKGYDVMSGITPFCAAPLWERDVKYVKPLINDMSLTKGKLTNYKDDCGIGYLQEEIIPATNFRSNVMYKHHLNIRYPNNLTRVGFREELWFSIKAILAKAKIGVNTKAIAWHIQTPSGGCRYPDYAECVRLDQETTEKWLKELYIEHGDFIEKYKRRV